MNTRREKAAPESAFPSGWALAEIVRGHAKARGDKPMLTSGAHSISFVEMDERSSRVAQGLLAEGVGPQDRVAILDKNGPEYFEILFGGAKLNAVNVAVNWRLAPAEVAYIINDAGAKVLFVGEEFLTTIAEVAPSLRSVTKIVLIGDDPRYERYDSWRDRHAAIDPGVPAKPDDVSMQLYTSGTTGLPKGAMLTHRNLGSMTPQVSPRLALDAESVSLVAMPLFHIGGSGWALVGMWIGCHSVLVRDLVPQELLRLIQQQRVTNAFLVPALLQALATLPHAAEGDYSSLRTIVYGASPITNDALTRVMQTFRCNVTQVYGLTETTGAITQLDPADHDPSGPRAHLLRSAGKPYPWVDVRVVDASTGQDQPGGTVGEIWTRSVQNMKGYWNNPEETAEVCTADGWFKTGDAGYLDGHGYLFLTDRIKDMIVSGGENIYPVEVENEIAAHPAVADVAVIGVPDERWGETVKAIVVLGQGRDRSAANEAAIIAFARERLAHFKCPTSVDFVARLPRNASGKLLKRELREPYWKGQERAIH